MTQIANVALQFKPGQVWTTGGGMHVRVLAAAVLRPMYVWDEQDNPGYVDRLALRIESVPPCDDAPAGGDWLDESCFAYMRLVEDIA